MVILFFWTSYVFLPAEKNRMVLAGAMFSADTWWYRVPSKQEFDAMSELLSLCTPASLLNFEVKIFPHLSLSCGLRSLINHSLSFLSSHLIERHKMAVFKLNMSQTEGLEKVVQGDGSLFIPSSQTKYVIMYFFRFTTNTVKCIKGNKGDRGVQWAAVICLSISQYPLLW